MSHLLPVEIDINKIQSSLTQASFELGKLNAIGNKESVKLLLERFVEKEALLSSQIEGTQSTLIEVLQEKYNKNPSIDMREVRNYFNAVNYGIERLKTLPLCSRFFGELHFILMENVRGGENQGAVGEYRKT